MNSFPMIKKLGLKIWDYKEPHHHFAVDAEELEVLLLRAQVVYGSPDTPSDQLAWSGTQLDCDTHKAILLNIEPIKKKTKAEAALEFLERLHSMSGIFNVSWPKDDMKRILEMKDEG